MSNTQMRNNGMLIAFQYIILFFGLIALFNFNACKSDRKKDISSERAFSHPEEYFKLDSTAVGINTIAENLEVPWEIAWGPDGWIWYSEIGGKVSKVNPVSGEIKVVLELEDVFTRTTPGLLGIAIHPDQENFPYLFTLYTQKRDESEVVLKVSRFTIEDDQGKDETILMEVPGGLGHNGSRIKIGNDGKVYIATGEGGVDEKAQDIDESGGKVLRINFDGTIPLDNPYSGSPVWARGFRNPQGMVLVENKLYVSDHGVATDDEINLVVKGGNYGWPLVDGYCDTDKEKEACRDSLMVEPLRAWTPTIAPAGIDYYKSDIIPEWENSILLSTLKGSSLRVLKLDSSGSSVLSEAIRLDWKFGRLRDICVSPAGDVYLSTSNRDWRASGIPEDNDDRIIRLSKVEEKNVLNTIPEYKHNKQINDDGTASLTGEELYTSYCSSCHQKDGMGITPFFPPLSQTKTVQGNKKNLIEIVLKGMSGIIEVKGVQYNELMPSFYFLSDQEIAKVLNYVRSNFGNEGDEILPDEVESIRDH